MTSTILIALLVMATASTGALFKPGAWYEGLAKPSWTPPKWAFPVVWTILYVMIGFAGWLVLEAAGPASTAFILWVVQLLLNAAWSWLFFGRRRMDQALIDVSALFVSILAFMVAAFPLSPTATLLFVPYAIWVATAAMLNRAVMKLNPGKVRG